MTLRSVVISLLLVVVMGCQPVEGPVEKGRLADAKGVAANTAGPILTVTNEYMDPVVSDVPHSPYTIMNIPPEVPLVFCWTAVAGEGGGDIESYRYGWDILDLNDPDMWETDFIPFDGSEVCAPPRTFFFGTHTFNVEVRDDLGVSSRAGIKVNILPGFVTFDIMPGSCKNPVNHRRRGLIPAVIAATPGMEIDWVDLSTIELLVGPTAIAPLRVEIFDVATPLINGEFCECPSGEPDGKDDIVLKFSAEEVIAALGPGSREDVREVSIRAVFTTGDELWGVDCVTFSGVPRPKDDGLHTRD